MLFTIALLPAPVSPQELRHDAPQQPLAQNSRLVNRQNVRNTFTTGPDHRKAAEFLFDRTDALLFMAIAFGGRECWLQATFARNELGLLRDPRVIFPALNSVDFHHRLMGISCLAFLYSKQGNVHLHRMAVGDPDPGVRQSALWGYCFANGEDRWELFRNLASNDPDEAVRFFARNLLMEADNDAALWEV